MGTACQQPTVNSLEVAQVKTHSQQPPHSGNSILDLSQSMLSNQQKFHDAPKAQPVHLPKLSHKVKSAVDLEYQRQPLAGPPLSFSHPPEYLQQHQACYQGDWKDGQPHGKGAIYFQSGAYFEGELKEGEVDCEDGILVLADGSCYRGSFLNSLFDGRGIFVSASDVTYEGEWRKGVPEGRGEEHFPDGNSYEGMFSKGLKSGEGIFRWTDGRIYEGEFRNGMMNGEGKFWKDQTELFEGEFRDNMKVGSNTLKTEHGKYTGQFNGGSIEGPGTFEWNDQTLYEGEFRNGFPHGEGTLKFLQGKTLVGLWEEGKNIKLKEVQPPSRIRSKSKSKKYAK